MALRAEDSNAADMVNYNYNYQPGAVMRGTGNKSEERGQATSHITFLFFASLPNRHVEC